MVPNSVIIGMANIMEMMVIYRRHFLLLIFTTGNLNFLFFIISAIRRGVRLQYKGSLGRLVSEYRTRSGISWVIVKR